MKFVLVDTCIWSLALRGTSPRDMKVANRLNIGIYTTDNDFKHYATILPVSLF